MAGDEAPARGAQEPHIRRDSEGRSADGHTVSITRGGRPGIEATRRRHLRYLKVRSM